MSILVVEDDPLIRSVLVRVLALAGHSVAEAADGRTALEWLRGGAELPSLILLDLMMPAMDGLAFRQEQLADPQLATVPVIVMSARGELSQTALPLKAAAVLPKPFNVIEVQELVARMICQIRQQATDAGEMHQPNAKT